jgi:rubrerythrin
MSNLKGSQTEQCLKEAFAHEAQAYRRYLYFANQADMEGHPDIAALFRSTAQGEVGHANGHLEFLQACADPVTGLPFGNTRDNLASAVASENLESGEMYVRMGQTARDEGFDEVADWFESLAKAENSHAARYQKAMAQFASPSAQTSEK